MAIKVSDKMKQRIVNFDNKEQLASGLDYDDYKAITDYFNIGMQEAMGSFIGGELFVTVDKKEFSNIIMDIWSENNNGLKKRNRDNNVLWYDYAFISDQNHIMRYTKEGIIHHVFYSEGKNTK